MTSLPRFFDPAPRYFTNNITGLPGAKLYFTVAGSSTPKTTYQNKAGTLAHAHPVVADSNGIFPPIFLDGLYKVELKNAAGVTQSGWPIDNIGQDENVVPFGPYSSTITYQTDEVVTDSAGDWYRSKVDSNVGHEPSSSPTQWEALVKPVPSNFVSDAAWATYSSGVGGTISLDIDVDAMSLDLVASGLKTDLSLNNVNNTSDANKPVSTAQQTALDLKLDKNGLTSVANGGLIFGNTANAGLTTLDWYQESTFSPDVVGTTSAGSATYTLQTGRWTRIGNRVDVFVQLAWTAHTGTGNVKINNLPYTSNATNFNTGVVYGSAALAFGAGLYGVATIGASTSSVLLYGIDPSGVAIPAACPLPASCLACHFSITYFV
jgi:hypothetical protein